MAHCSKGLGDVGANNRSCHTRRLESLQNLPIFSYREIEDLSWLLYGYYMVIIWLLYGYYMVIIWLLYGYYMVIIWLLYGHYMVIIWLLYGYYMVIIWLLYGHYMVIIWLLYGYYMVNDSIAGWWYTYPSEKILGSWDDHSQYMENDETCSKPPKFFKLSCWRGQLILQLVGSFQGKRKTPGLRDSGQGTQSFGGIQVNQTTRRVRVPRLQEHESFQAWLGRHGHRENNENWLVVSTYPS